MKLIKSLTIFTLFFFLFSSCGQKDYKRILEVGIIGKGVIQTIEDTGSTFNDNPQVVMNILVYSKENDPFYADVVSVVSRVSIPQRGNTLAVKYDPEDHSKVIWLLDKDITAEMQKQIDRL